MAKCLVVLVLLAPVVLSACQQAPPAPTPTVVATGSVEASPSTTRTVSATLSPEAEQVLRDFFADRETLMRTGQVPARLPTLVTGQAADMANVGFGVSAIRTAALNAPRPVQRPCPGTGVKRGEGRGRPPRPSPASR